MTLVKIDFLVNLITLVIQAFFPFSALASFFKFSIEMDLESGRKVSKENAWLKSGRSDAEPRREVETGKST